MIKGLTFDHCEGKIMAESPIKHIVKTKAGSDFLAAEIDLLPAVDLDTNLKCEGPYILVEGVRIRDRGVPDKEPVPGIFMVPWESIDHVEDQTRKSSLLRVPQLATSSPAKPEQWSEARSALHIGVRTQFTEPDKETDNDR